MIHLFHKTFYFSSVTNWAIIKQWINNYIYAVKSKQQIHIYTKCVFVRVLAVIMHERMFHRCAFYHTAQSVSYYWIHFKFLTLWDYIERHVMAWVDIFFVFCIDSTYPNIFFCYSKWWEVQRPWFFLNRFHVEADFFWFMLGLDSR